MGKLWCAAVGCSNSSDKQKEELMDKYPGIENVKFYAFPGPVKKPKLRKIWLDLVKRENFQPTKYSRICSRHFQDELLPDKNKDGYPTLFEWNHYGQAKRKRETLNSSVVEAKTEGSSTSKKQKFQATNISSSTNITDNNNNETQEIRRKKEISAVGVHIVKIVRANSIGENGVMATNDHIHSTNNKTSSSTQTDFDDDEIERLKAKIKQLEKEKDEATLSNLFISKSMESDKNVRHYTGLPNKEVLLGLFNSIEENVSPIKYWKGKSSIKVKNYEETNRKKPGRSRKLSKFTEYLIVLYKMKHDFSSEILAHMFQISNSTLSQILITWINVLYQVSKLCIFVPPSHIVRSHIPLSFKKDFPKTTAIIDCTEFYIEKPHNPNAQCVTYSSYKSHNTFKVLVSVTPSGAFTFISPLYGGNASDRYIVEDSDFIDTVKRGDEVMADRGFKIRDLLTLKKATLVIPAFTKKCKYGKGKMLTVKDIRSTRTIAKHRIHVERAIERLKRWKMISNIIPLSMKPIAHQTVCVIAMICNLYDPLIKN